MGVQDDKTPKPKKSFIFYYLIVMIIVMLLNVCLIPWMAEKSVMEVSYSQFLDMVDAGQVSEVQQSAEQITFYATGEDGRPGVYKTAHGRMKL